MTEPNFANRTMWIGDNLDIMRGMNSECVDLSYLDPPFNSNRNYAAPIGSEAADRLGRHRPYRQPAAALRRLQQREGRGQPRGAAGQAEAAGDY